MKLLFSTLAVSILITGCASTPPKLTQKELAKEELAKISKVEIYYHPSSYTIVDGGGSSMAGLGGALGLFGMFAALAVDAGSKLTAVERAEARSKEFNQLMLDAQVADINKEQAEAIARMIASTGREVKLTAIKRPAGDFSKDQEFASNVQWSEGYAPLILRATTGYAAESATASYQSVAVTEYVLKDASGKQLIKNKLIRRGSGDTYQTFDGLKGATGAVVVVLNKDMQTQATELHQQSFEPEQAKK